MARLDLAGLANSQAAGAPCSQTGEWQAEAWTFPGLTSLGRLGFLWHRLRASLWSLWLPHFKDERSVECLAQNRRASQYGALAPPSRSLCPSPPEPPSPPSSLAHRTDRTFVGGRQWVFNRLWWRISTLPPGKWARVGHRQASTQGRGTHLVVFRASDPVCVTQVVAPALATMHQWVQTTTGRERNGNHEGRFWGRGMCHHRHMHSHKCMS